MASLFFTKVEGQHPIIEFPCANLSADEAQRTAEVIWGQKLNFVAFEDKGVRRYLNG